MSDAEKIKKVLMGLDERLAEGSLSEATYKTLKKRWETMLEDLSASSQGSVRSTEDLAEDPLFQEALSKVVTRVYACDYCGAVLNVTERVGKVKCSFCGFVNEVDYLRRISERVREEKARIIKEAMETFARVSNLEELRLPLHERFKVASYSYESKALELETRLWDLKSSLAEGDASRIRGISGVEKELYEASKVWHQTAELLRNASEFAPTPTERGGELAASHFFDGLGFFNAAFVPMLLKKFEPLEELRRRWEFFSENWVSSASAYREYPTASYDSLEKIKEQKLSKLREEIRNAEHPISIRPGYALPTFQSSLEATDCFLKAFELSKEEQYLSYALVSKLLVYISYAEGIRDQRLVGLQILRNIKGILNLMKKRVSPVSIVDITLSLRSLVKGFADFATQNFENYIEGLEIDWKERGFSIGERGRGIHFSDFTIEWGGFPDKVEKVFNEKTATLTLEGTGNKRGEIKRGVGFRFSWALGRTKESLFRYSEPFVCLIIEAPSENLKRKVSVSVFFTSLFKAFMWLSGCPNILMNYIGKGYPEEERLLIQIGERAWAVQLTCKQFLDLYTSLCLLFTKIEHSSAQRVGSSFKEQIGYVKSWKERTQELSMLEVPRILEGEKTRGLKPETIYFDIAYLSFLRDALIKLPLPSEKVLKEEEEEEEED